MQKHKLAAIIIITVLAAIFKWPIEWSDQGVTLSEDEIHSSTKSVDNDHKKLKELIQNRQSGVMITIDARVKKILPDDLEGSKHQRMILEVLNTSVTLLLAHNIDLAPRVPASENEIIRIYGQYEWNEKGGVIHWTHRDKRNKHPHGWVEYNNNRYQ